MTTIADLTDPAPPPEARVLYAPHRGRWRFFNPWWAHTPRLRDVVRWWLGPNPYAAFKRRPPAVPVVPHHGAPLGGGPDGAADTALTWIGHASFALEDGGEVALTDPHFGPRALLPQRRSPPGVPLAAVPEDAFAVLSHNHYDHLDRWTVRRLPPEVDWYVPLGMKRWFDRLGWFGRPSRRGPRRVVELDWWQSVRRGRWTLTCLPAQHWSNRASQLRNAALWCSWLLDSGRARVYFAADGGYFPGFAEIGRRFPGIDVAILPIGAYEPRWFMHYQHMNPGEAYRAFDDLGAHWMVAAHWGTFDLTDEPVDLAPAVLARVVAEAGGDPRVKTLSVGERWRLP